MVGPTLQGFGDLTVIRGDNRWGTSLQVTPPTTTTTHTRQGRQSWPGLVQLAWPSVNPEGELQGTQANSCLTYAETSMLL